MDNLIIIKGDKIHFPKAFFRGNGSIVQFSPTNFLSPKGILFPLDFYSFALNDYLRSGMEAVMTMDIPLRGVLLGPGKMIYEITVKRVTKGDNTIEALTPMQWEPDVRYARGSEPLLDVIGGVGLQEDANPEEILAAAAKLTNLNVNHYNNMSISEYFGVVEGILSKRKKQ